MEIWSIEEGVGVRSRKDKEIWSFGGEGILVTLQPTFWCSGEHKRGFSADDRAKKL